MTDISSFNSDDRNFSVEDFNEDEGISNVHVTNPASNTNMAAYMAMLSGPENVEASFRTIKSELDEANFSESSEAILEQVRANRMVQANKSLSDFLINPNFSLDEKQQIATSFLEEREKASSIRNIVGEFAIADDSEGETFEAEQVRIDTSFILREMNEYKAYVQSLLNAEAAKSDPTIAKSVINFAEVMIPFIEGVNLAGIVDEFNQGEDTTETYGKALVLLGSSKEQVKNALLKMPFEDRREAARGTPPTWPRAGRPASATSATTPSARAAARR